MNKIMLSFAAFAAMVLGANSATYYPITINYEPAATVADFPVLVRIPAGSGIYQTAGEGGANLRFTDSLGVNEYPHEIDTWNASGESLVWVKIPELKTNFEFRLYCEGSATTAAKDVWSAYAGVWHLNEAVDSADKDYDPAAAEPTHTTRFYTEEGTTRVLSDGVLGKGLGSTKGTGAAFSSKVYDDRNGHKCPIQVTNPSKFTVSCWVRVQDVAQWTDLFGPVSSNGGETGWKAEWTANDSSNGLNIRMCQYGVNGSSQKYFEKIKVLLSGWHKLDAIWDSTTLALYVDGELFGQRTDCPIEPKWYWTGWMGWGGCINSNGALADTGKASGTDFDECRIYDGVKSADRIAADYQTVMSETFLTIGPATEEQPIPAGTVAQVGASYYQNFAEAVAVSRAGGGTPLTVILMANGQFWTFMEEDETLIVKLGGMSFSPNNGRGEGYYIDASLDPSTDVTTFTLKKQVVIAAMRNVAVFKLLETQDLYDLLPKTVKGLAADGSLAPGDYDVEWDTSNVSKYGSFGVSTVSGLATVGGMKLPVTAYVRAALSYSDGYHNIAQEASSMTVIAPGKDGHQEITNVNEIMSGGNTAMITNGLPAGMQRTDDGGYSWTTDPSPSFVNHQSAEAGNPFLDVSFTWPEVKNVHRIEVVCQGGDNGASLKTFEFYSDGVLLSPTSYMEDNSSRPKIDNVHNRCFDFTTPVAIDDLKVSLEQFEKTERGNAGRINIDEILIWADGGPIDVTEPSTSAELVELAFDGKPVELSPGLFSYIALRAREMTTALGEANVAVTVLPEVDGMIRIVTLAEDGVTSALYKVRTHAGFNVTIR